jgi:hypothetical protein
MPVLVGLLVVLLGTLGMWVWAQAAIAPAARPHVVRGARAPILRVETARPGAEFARGAVGLSTEARALSTGLLTPSHPRLVRLMRLLGPSVLRIGGNTVDRSWWTSSGEHSPRWATNAVTPADLVLLHGLLAATGWHVVLGIDLGHFEPARVASEASSAQQIFGSELQGIEIGNEPNDFGHSGNGLRAPGYEIPEYLREVEAYDKALAAAAPGVAVYGPAASTAGIQWLAQMGGAARIFTTVTQHYYAIKECSQTTPPAPQPTAAALLVPAIREEEDRILSTLSEVGALAGRPTRIGETNSVACPGTVDASPTFAGALWALDWALRAASSGVTGLNFHGGVAGCGINGESPICASPGESAERGDVSAQADYYGLLAASMLEGGRFVPVRMVGGGQLPNLTTWATLSPNGTVRIAIDNFASTGRPQPVIVPAASYAASSVALSAPSIDARTAITLGKVAVPSNTPWRPRPAGLRRRRSVRIVVRPASAVIVTLRPRRRR